MKVSLAWIFDHIDADINNYSAEEIVHIFNQKTAEIEHYYSHSLPIDHLALTEKIEIGADSISAFIPEWNLTVSLPLRKECSASKDSSYFVYKNSESGTVEWARGEHLDLSKEGLLPAIKYSSEDKKGHWKKNCELHDTIIEVDNKSLTHRPDMWCHRGFAREIAAFINKPLKNPENFLAPVSIATFKNSPRASFKNGFTLENQATNLVPRFCGLYIDHSINTPSLINIALRLLRVDTRAINAVVDLTNYVMLDWGQPLHAFDADSLDDRSIIVRKAHDKETVSLLDSRTIELTSHDVVVADSEQALALAGIMGGDSSGVTLQTTSLFVEAATFDATTIRKSAFHHKLRTEASARFEKTLDRALPPQALQRFSFLAQQHAVIESLPSQIIALGEEPQSLSITLSHSYLENKLGIVLESEQVQSLLMPLEFSVNYNEKNKEYTIDVPSFRSSKDIKAQEDILEEVARLYGFKNITPALPSFVCRPRPETHVFKLRKIKNYLAQGAGMIEQQNYALYDESILAQMNYDPDTCVQIKNPISQNYVRLVSMLMPNLFKNVQDNYRDHHHLRFFEVGRTWHKEGSSIAERKRVAGIFFDRYKKIDFYQCKYYLDTLFKSLMLDVEWRKTNNPNYVPWTKPEETAQMMFGSTLLGQCGKVNPTFWPRLDIPAESDAFVFGFDLDFIIGYQAPTPTFHPSSKFQEVTFDLSCFVPLSLEAHTLEKSVRECDPLIIDVALIDFFEKKEWTDKRSLAFRITVVHPSKTLEKEEIETIRTKAIATFEQHGATIRS